MSKEIRAAGYIRVSSEGQTDNTSLPEQRRLIKNYVSQYNYKLTKIYADEGISGKTTKDRPDMLKALDDAKAGKFDILIVRDTSRFGRDLLEILQNHKAFENAGVKLLAVKEDIQNTMYMQIKGIFAEQEWKTTKERMVGGKISRALDGIPPTNKLPFGRTFNEEKEKGKRWNVDQNKVDAIEWVYQEYVKKDRSLRKIAEEIEGRFGFPITYHYLTTVLKEKCGTYWEMNFEEHGEPISFEIPPLLKPHQIQAIKDRLAHNRTNNRTDTKDYLLTGFIRCIHCGKSLSGFSPHKGRYEYYQHSSSKTTTCDAFTTVSLPKVEKEVFEMIFDDIGDTASFEKAIKDSLPDTKYIEKVENEIDTKKQRLKEVKTKRKRLVQAVLDGKLEEDNTEETDTELKETEERLTNEIDEAQNRLDNLPDPEEVKKQAHQIRIELLDKYKSEEHLQEMTFKEKKRLLHFLFDGKAPDGKGYGGHGEYGIYVDKKGKGQSADYHYWLFGRLRASRSIKDDDDSGGKDDRKRLFDVDHKNDFTHKKSDYKTNNFASRQKNKKKF